MRQVKAIVTALTCLLCLKAILVGCSASFANATLPTIVKHLYAKEFRGLYFLALADIVERLFRSQFAWRLMIARAGFKAG